MNPPSGTQLSFLSDAQPGRRLIVNPRMASNVLLRILDQAGLSDTGSTPSASAVVFLRTIFPWAAIAAERANGLPVTKTTVRPYLESPTRAIILVPPRPEEVEQVEALLEFVQRRLAVPQQQMQIAAAAAELLGPRTSELLITPDTIPSPLFAQDRADATAMFRPLLRADTPEALEYLVETCVLLRANHCDLQTGLEKLFWRQDAAAAELFAAGCADGKARAYFIDWPNQPEERHRKVLSAVNADTLAAAFGNSKSDA